jgi:uncharacterized protein (DUF1697 family)
MKYIAFLRGINVGGNNLISMLALKEAFGKDGFTNVGTYINSGNVIFESDEKNIEKLTKQLEVLLTKTFTYKARVVVKSHEQLKEIAANVPKEWKTNTDIRCYMGFLTEFVTDADIKEIKLREGIDSMKVSNGVIYMTTLLSGLTKSGFTKMASQKIYKEMTIRNYTTTKKILNLMEQKDS